MEEITHLESVNLIRYLLSRGIYSTMYVCITQLQSVSMDGVHPVLALGVYFPILLYIVQCMFMYM